jgi:osmoprotectant transport system permease protein
MTTAFFIAKLPELLEKIWQQVYLTGLALFLATAIGIPLGTFAAHTKKLKTFIIGIANILQTIPSLALLAFLIPFLGIGIKPAIVTLAIYALLPIVRNTVTGIETIAPGMVEAADSLGFTTWQTLRLVQLPLAAPVILAGIRIATSMCVGIATVAAFIGAGGLGDFIFQGIALNDNRLLLLGAIPAGLLALFLDFLLAKIENRIAEHKIRWRGYKSLKKIIISIVVILVIFFSFFAKPLYNNWQQNQNNTIRIATKNFTEQFILGYIMADLIEAKTHLRIERKFNLGPTDICQRAMEKGEIDIYPEYTGTAYELILKQQNPGTADQVYQTVKNNYMQKFNIVWLAPFGFNDSQTIAVPEEFAKHYQLQDISDLVPYANKLTIGVPAEFMERADGFPGLNKKYGITFGTVRQMDPGLMYKAIKNHNVDAILAFSTDGRIAAYHLQILADNKHLFPPYFAAPLIRAAVLQKHPEIATALQPLANLINDQTMQQLNYEVDVEKHSPQTVARNFLIAKGLLK